MKEIHEVVATGMHVSQIPHLPSQIYPMHLSGSNARGDLGYRARYIFSSLWLQAKHSTSLYQRYRERHQIHRHQHPANSPQTELAREDGGGDGGGELVLFKALTQS